MRKMNSENHKDFIQELSKHFFLSEPATQDQLKAVASQVGTTIDRLPSTLIDFWTISSEWHSLNHGHYNVFGFNFYPPEKALDSTCIFGDEELRFEWRDEHTDLAGVSCAEEGWINIGAFSEYDYLFCCIDPKKEEFGQVRHIINNCFEESAFCHIDKLPKYLSWMAECLSQLNEDSSEDDVKTLIGQMELPNR